MASSADRFYLHITAGSQEFCLERGPFGNLTFVDLPPLIGDRSGHGHVTLTYRYFRNNRFSSLRPMISSFQVCQGEFQFARR
jgi:hypothetical protein